MSEDNITPKNDIDWKAIKYIIITVGIIFSVAYVGLAFYKMYNPELYNSPWQLEPELDKQKLNEGYDLVCVSRLNAQLCMINKTDINIVGHFANKITVEYFKNPCLNVYLESDEKTIDYFNKTDTDYRQDGTGQCLPLLNFAIDDGWKYQRMESKNVTDFKYRGLISAEKLLTKEQMDEQKRLDQMKGGENI